MERPAWWTVFFPIWLLKFLLCLKMFLNECLVNHKSCELKLLGVEIRNMKKEKKNSCNASGTAEFAPEMENREY